MANSSHPGPGTRDVPGLLLGAEACGAGREVAADVGVAVECRSWGIHLISHLEPWHLVTLETQLCWAVAQAGVACPLSAATGS